jgi:TatD DNase family protein
MTDTHSHIYLDDFDGDREQVVARAKAAGILQIILPNVDISTLEAMNRLRESDPDYFGTAAGLHPASVNAGFAEALETVEQELASGKHIAAGEIGLDYYWDKTFCTEQATAFEQQLLMAKKYSLPVIIHCREAFEECFSLVEKNHSEQLRGVFHCFGGSVEQAQKIMSLGNFMIGINGIVSYKNSGLSEVLPQVPINYIVTETDAPYLTPVPYRGKRNESSYIIYVIKKLAEIYGKDEEAIKSITTENAEKMFKKSK